MICLVGIGDVRLMPYLRVADCHLFDSVAEALVFATSLDVRAIVHVRVGEVESLCIDATVVPPSVTIQRQGLANVGHGEATLFRDALATAYREIAQRVLGVHCSRCPVWGAAVMRTFAGDVCTVHTLRRYLSERVGRRRCALETQDARMLVTAPVVLAISARARIGCSLAVAIRESGVSERTFRRWHPTVDRDTTQPLATMRPRRLIAAWSGGILRAMSNASHRCALMRSPAERTAKRQ